jgi:lipopolysaccharide transport system ATP-binding protein
MSNVIEIENLSKVYRLGVVSTRSLVEDIAKYFAKMRGREDPFLKLAEVNEKGKKGLSDYVWALKNINFSVNQGEILGIIGRNGAGKSTLLKILSRVTNPTSGTIRVKGRLASLLEVGTGFHRELSGRENIFLNGAVLGMSKKEIERKFDDIVDFSGVERYIDTPVKRYSSGMYVRLAFAVAAYLDPEIMVVDEVLAVGDAEFQKKCIGKMQDVSAKEGRTVLFVSHNMAAVQNLCTKGINIEDGELIFEGKIDEAVSKYLSSNTTVDTGEIELKERSDRVNGRNFMFTGIELKDAVGNKISQIISGEPATIEMKYEIKERLDGNLILFVGIYDGFGNLKSSFVTDEMGKKFENLEGKGSIFLKIPRMMLRADGYFVKLISYLNTTKSDDILDKIENAKSFQILQGDFWKTGNLNRLGSYSLMDAEYYN